MLEARGLTKSYSSITAARDVTFRVEKGAVLGLLGPNDSGKSTTVGMLTGLLEPSHGSVELDGVNVRSDMLRRTPRDALARAASPARSVRVARDGNGRFIESLVVVSPARALARGCAGLLRPRGSRLRRAIARSALA